MLAKAMDVNPRSDVTAVIPPRLGGVATLRDVARAAADPAVSIPVP